MIKRPIILSAFLLLLSGSVAWASCGSATCPLDMHRYVSQGLLQVSLVQEYINQDQLYLGRHKSFVGAVLGDHDEVQTINDRTVFQLHYGMMTRLGFNFDLPLIHRRHSHIGHEEGQDVWEYWNFSGLGDLTLSGQIGVLLPVGGVGPYLSFGAGLKLPTGVTNAKNADGELAEVTIQPGTGSTDAIFGVNYRQSLLTAPTLTGKVSSMPFSAGLSYQANGKGTDNYRFGNTLLAHLGLVYQFLDRAALPLQLNARIQDFADVGLTGEPRENTGGIWVYFSPGLEVNLSEVFSFNTFVQVPIYQYVHGLQQTARFNLQLGLSASVSIM
jgi:hypothetical protein